MKRFRRIMAFLLMLTLCLSPAKCFASAQGLFEVPSFIKQIGSEAFSGVDVSGGVFIPDTCTSIAPDAFSNPEALTVYGFSGSAAEAYADAAGASFIPIGIQNASLAGPAWASPDREVTFTADFDSKEETEISFEIVKDNEIIHTSAPSKDLSFSYTFRSGGEYEITAIIQSHFETVLCPLPAPIVVAERIKTNEEIFYLTIGETASLISEDETRAVTLSAGTDGLTISGSSVTAKALGKYIVTAAAETEQGTVYTDIPVEVIVPTSSITIKSERPYVLEGHTLKLSAEVLPENATYQDVAWSVENPETATISEDGLLTGIMKGTSVIFATSGDIMAVHEISVEKGVSSFEIIPVDMPSILYSGMNFGLSAIASPEDAYNPSASFESLTPDICSVDSFTGKVTCLKEGEALIRATANDLGGAEAEYAFTVYPGVSDIIFTSTPGILREDDTFQLEMDILPDNAPDKTIEFASSNEDIITVTETGLISAVAPGSAYVTAKAVNGYKTSVSVTVMTPVSSIASALDTLYLNPGMTADPIGNFVFVKPENATNPSLTWSSDNGFVASVDKNTGLITAANTGTCTIKGVTHNGKIVTFNVMVVSDAPVIKKLAISSTYGALNVGNTAVLQPKVDVNNKYVSGTWYSDHPEILDIVSIDSSNKATIKAFSPGQATIYAITSSGISARCTVVVNPIVVTGMYLNASSVSLNVDDRFPLSAVFHPENATATRLTWTSSNEKVAAVDENGLVHALTGGSTTITATAEDGVSASCRVTVNTILMTDAHMDESEITVLAGESGYPSYTVTPSDATPANFFWRSNDPSVVSISSLTGEMKYLKAGSAVISATALDGSGINISMTVNVKEVPVTSFTVNTDAVTLRPGEEFALYTRVLPVGASYAKPVFETGDETIATVSADGVIHAVSKGETTIRVSVGNNDYLHTIEIPVTVEKVNDVTYRALIMGQFTVPATDGYLPFSNNSTKGFTDAISRASIDGNRYEITRIAGSPSAGAIRSAISRMANQADENDVTVIFFLTHGTNSGSEGYQMQTNSGIAIEPINMIGALKEISGHVVFVLCTCHSGRILNTSGAAALRNAGGSYEGLNGKGHLSILCSSTSTNSSYYRVNDEKRSYDFYTYAVTRGLGWDMVNDYAISLLYADANGDGKITVSELAAYSRGATQRAISSFLQQNGTSEFSGHPSQFPSWQIARGDEDLVIFER